MTSPGAFRRILSEDPPLDRSSACSSPRLSVSSGMSFSDVTGGEEDYSPLSPKRQRLHYDDAFLPQSLRGSVRGSRDSPGSELSISNLLGDISVDDFGSCSFDDVADDSTVASVSDHGLSSFRKKYKKHELWASIRSDYHYLMDKEIIETCKSTESDLSWESDDLASNPNVSFAEFLQQYKELSDWLNHIEAATKVNVSSLSEKYLNQTYHEEMLARSPRKKLFNDYAKQLMRRYPQMREEIQGRLQHLNTHWGSLQRAILPAHGYQDHQTMLTDLEHDLSSLRQWLHKVESEVVPLTIRPEWTVDDLKQRLQQHEGLQRDIESHSKIVNAVLKLCERLRQDQGACSDSSDSDALRLLAVNLESRWHAIWLQSLEWRCRLEEAIAGGQRRLDRGHYGYSPEGADLLEDNEDSFMDTNDDETVSSDPGNYDVIPFSDNEYERIVETDDGGDKMSDCDNGLKSDRNASDLDSALGKSSSDPSVSECHHDMAARHADRSAKMIASSQDGGSTTQNATKLSLKRSPLKSDSRDIGYSSESHSNEEAETGHVTDDLKKHVRSCQNLEAVLRRKDLGGSTGSLQPSTRWRHSMTSAYDTSSTCSDLNLLADKGLGRTGSEEAVSDNVQSLINSPSHRFYCMTSIDTDSADSSTRWQNNSAVNARSPVSPASPVDESSAVRIRDFDVTKMKLVTHSLSDQLDADAGLPPMTDDKSYGSIECLSRSPVGVRRECVRRLIQQAELLIHDADLWHLQSSCRLLQESAKVVKQQQERRHHHAKLNQSLTSTDGSLVITTTEDSQLSSCDASSEGSDEEFSTASSDGRPSSLNDTTFFTMRSHSVSPAKSDIIVTRKLSPKKRRHHLSESRADLGPLSNSESAIDRLHYKRPTTTHTPVSPKLRRTSSEASTPPRGHSPQKGRHLRMRRSKSDELDRKRLTSTPQFDSSVTYTVERCDVRSTRKCLELDQAVPSCSPTHRLTSIASETDDVFNHQGDSDIELARLETDDTDGVVPGLLSTTQESFSEHAWDPYQAPPYTSVSDDCTEEKLDPGKLQADWEHTLEYEEEFPFDNSFGCSPMAPLDTTRGSGNKRSQNSWFSSSGYHGDANGDNSRVDYDDTDSDVDDFHYVITESQKAMDFTESTLAIKPGKDAMETGVYLNPSEYVDPLATCQTNVKCLQEVIDTLQMDEGLTNVPLDDIAMVQRVIDKWRRLERVTVKRQDQSKQLFEMYKQIMGADACIDRCRDNLSVKTFGDPSELEAAIKAVLSSTTELVSQKVEMTTLQRRVRVFAGKNKEVHMAKFAEDVTQILDDIGDNLKMSTLHVAQLRPQLTGWTEYNKAVTQLTDSLNRERQRLQCLHLAADVVSLSTQEMMDTVTDLKVMQSEFGTYDCHMAALRDLYTSVGSLSSHQMEMHAEVAVLSNQLASMKCQCQEMIVAMETRLLMQRNKEEKAKLAVLTRVRTKRPVTRPKTDRSWWSLLLYILKWGVPLATIFVVVMCCLIDPFPDHPGLSISPDLRYVRGPPPT